MSSTDANDAAGVREGALRLLARREHSRRELEQKLARRGWEEALIASCLDELALAGLQSDERFAESFARARIDRAYGPLRIRAELTQRGIDRNLVQTVLRTLAPDWLAVAADWYERRWGQEPPADLRDKARRQQALARRGFTHEHYRELLD